MSYEHCKKHDQDATNGCPECAADALFDKCVKGGERALETFARLTGDPCPEDYREPMIHCCAVVFLDGLASYEGQHELDPKTIHAVRTTLEAILLPGARAGHAGPAASSHVRGST